MAQEMGCQPVLPTQSPIASPCEIPKASDHRPATRFPGSGTVSESLARTSAETPMWRLSQRACWLWLSGILGFASGPERPWWYYGGPDGHYGTPEAYQQPPKSSLPAQSVLLYSYWVIQSLLVILAISLAFLGIKHAYKVLKKRMKPDPPRQEDPEELALMETLHLLDAVMMKMWRHLKWLEKRKRRQARGRPKAHH